MAQDRGRHWQKVYETKAPSDVSWYEPVPQQSLDLIQAAGLPPEAAIVDIGGGTSTLVDHLLAAGFIDVSVLDIAPAALAAAKKQLGVKGTRVKWITADVTMWHPDRQYDLWHDRAVFHFLLSPELRDRYVETLRAALVPCGHLVMATFGPKGPTRCSGLGVQRYSADELSTVLGPEFDLVRSEIEEHTTPAGGTQEFLYGWWRIP